MLKNKILKLFEDNYWRRFPNLTQEYRRPEEDKIIDGLADVYNSISEYLKNNNKSDLLHKVADNIHDIQRVFINIQLERLDAKR